MSTRQRISMCVRTVQIEVTYTRCEGVRKRVGERGRCRDKRGSYEDGTTTIAIATVTAHQMWNISLITQHTQDSVILSRPRFVPHLSVGIIITVPVPVPIPIPPLSPFSAHLILCISMLISCQQRLS